MKLVRIGLSLLLAVPAVACGQGSQQSSGRQSGQTSTPEPSQLSIELAKALAFPRLLTMRRTTPEEMAERIERSLFSVHLAPRGVGCEPTHPECAAAAEKIASKYAAKYVQSLNDSMDRLHAHAIQAKMTPAQIRMTLEFIRTDAGRAFAGSLRFPETEADMMLLMTSARTITLPAPPYDEFFEATKNLPRAALRRVPPPPRMPPPRSTERSN